MGTQYTGTVLGDGPYAYYHMDEASGTTLHDAASLGSPKNGTINASGVTYSAAGAITSDSDTSLSFDGTAGFATLPASAKTDGFAAISVEHWFFLTSVTFASFPRTVTGGSSSSFDFFFDNNATAISFNVNNVQAKWTNTFVISTWHHVVGTYDGTTMTLYVDGTSRATHALTGTVNSSGNNPAIGKDSGFAGQFLPGRVDEIALYNYALNSTQVTAHYNAGIAKNTAMYTIPSNTRARVIQSEDINQAINTLQQPSGGQEIGHYNLSGPGYAVNAAVSKYIVSLSRGSVPVSVTVDATDLANSGYTTSPPSTSKLTANGFQVFDTCVTGAQLSAKIGGQYTIQY